MERLPLYASNKDKYNWKDNDLPPILNKTDLTFVEELRYNGVVTISLAKLKDEIDVAVKSIPSDTIRDGKREYIDLIYDEIFVQKMLDHPNILKILGCYEEDKEISLVLEYAAGGDLHALRNSMSDGKLNESRVALYAWQTILALLYCHSKGIVHGDVKPDNIFLFEDNIIKLGDFGLCHHIDNSKGVFSEEIHGTLDFVAPEVIDKKGLFFCSDVWSLGATIYELICGKPPFEDFRYTITFKLILSATYTFPDHTFSDSAKSLISKIFVVDMEKRITLLEMLDDPWLYGIKK